MYLQNIVDKWLCKYKASLICYIYYNPFPTIKWYSRWPYFHNKSKHKTNAEKRMLTERNTDTRRMLLTQLNM